MLNKICRFYIGLFFAILIPFAQASDFHSPRTDALGGAGHASPLLSDAIYLNPSYMPYIHTHSFSFSYLSFGGGTITTPNGNTDFYGHNINLSVMDGSPDSLFQAGVGYTRRDDVSMFHISAAKQAFSSLGIGIGTKFILPNDSSGKQLFDGTLSLTGMLSSWLQAVLIVDNLLGNAVDRGFQREYVLGTKINIMSIVFFYVDPHWVPSLSPDNTLGYEAGAEFPFMQDVFLRLGTFQNSSIPYQAQRGNGYGIGLGWLGPKLSLDYAYSRVINPLSSISHNFSATLYF